MKSRVYYGEYSVKHWLELMLKREVELPSYQRQFRWTKEQVISFINAVKEQRFIPPVTIGSFVKDDVRHNYIIDGQQRLSSLLLGYFGKYPLQSAFVERGNALAARDGADDDQDESFSPQAWRFDMLIGGKPISNDNLRREASNAARYEDLGCDLSGVDCESLFLGFCYIVPGERESARQQEFYATTFHDLNTRGASLDPLESRRSLYFLKDDLEGFFEPEFAKKITLQSASKDRVANLDFVRYLSVLSEYKKGGNIDRVAKGYRDDMEPYYIDYIYNAFGERTSGKFSSINELFQDGNYKADLVKLSSATRELGLARVYPSIIDMDVYFFGLINVYMFEKYSIDIEKKDELLRKLKEKSDAFRRDDKHSRAPGRLRHFRERIKASIDIYRGFAAV